MEFQNAKLSVLDKGTKKEIIFRLKTEKSFEYPFKIKIGPDYGDSPRPGMKGDLSITVGAYMDIEQLHNCIKLKNMSKMSINEVKVMFVDDKTGKELNRIRYGELVAPHYLRNMMRKLLSF